MWQPVTIQQLTDIYYCPCFTAVPKACACGTPCGGEKNGEDYAAACGIDTDPGVEVLQKMLWAEFGNSKLQYVDPETWDDLFNINVINLDTGEFVGDDNPKREWYHFFTYMPYAGYEHQSSMLLKTQKDGSTLYLVKFFGCSSYGALEQYLRVAPGEKDKYADFLKFRRQREEQRKKETEEMISLNVS